jgi:hypothetical protein
MRLGSFRLGASYRPRIAGRTLKVDIDHASELFQRHLRRCSIAGDASVVDVDVESAESVHRLRQHAAYPIFIGDSTGIAHARRSPAVMVVSAAELPISRCSGLHATARSDRRGLTEASQVRKWFPSEPPSTECVRRLVLVALIGEHPQGGGFRGDDPFE